MKNEQSNTGGINHEFVIGQRYMIKHGSYCRTMRVDSIGDGFVRFVDVNDSRVMCSGELYSICLQSCLCLQSCQSCNIDGCDVVFSYDLIRD